MVGAWHGYGMASVNQTRRGWERHAVCESALNKPHALLRIRRETAVLCCGLEKNGMVGAWHGKYESDTAALSKSNGKDTF
jgi:hypothetical protein